MQGPCLEPHRYVPSICSIDMVVHRYVGRLAAARQGVRKGVGPIRVPAPGLVCLCSCMGPATHPLLGHVPLSAPVVCACFSRVVMCDSLACRALLLSWLVSSGWRPRACACLLPCWCSLPCYCVCCLLLMNNLYFTDIFFRKLFFLHLSQI